MKLGFALATLLVIFGGALLIAPAQATTVPAQCAGMTFTNVIDKPTQSLSVTGTAGNDLIILAGGIVHGGDGDDCIVFKSTTGSGIAYGEGGNDVLVSSQKKNTSGGAMGDYTLSPSPVYGTTPINLPCDEEAEDETGCIYPVTYLPEGYDRCIGNWQYRQACEATN